MLNSVSQKDTGGTRYSDTRLLSRGLLGEPPSSPKISDSRYQKLGVAKYRNRLIVTMNQRNKLSACLPVHDELCLSYEFCTLVFCTSQQPC